MVSSPDVLSSFLVKLSEAVHEFLHLTYITLQGQIAYPLKRLAGNLYSSGCKYELKMSIWIASIKTLVREVIVYHFHLRDICICVTLKIL
ncbi:hypothetical protein HanLR1_Chr10g0369311 [Helianthus annuus]|nr:hypothetical protein HanHA89_Chr10g0391901 [Helianthus annuus]KAJ0697476.1 hypothetical protein HanLR1_Chr10g0369311 [Helianthus annuus]